MLDANRIRQRGQTIISVIAIIIAVAFVVLAVYSYFQFEEKDNIIQNLQYGEDGNNHPELQDQLSQTGFGIEDLSYQNNQTKTAIDETRSLSGVDSIESLDATLRDAANRLGLSADDTALTSFRTMLQRILLLRSQLEQSIDSYNREIATLKEKTALVISEQNAYEQKFTEQYNELKEKYDRIVDKYNEKINKVQSDIAELKKSNVETDQAIERYTMNERDISEKTSSYIASTEKEIDVLAQQNKQILETPESDLIGKSFDGKILRVDINLNDAYINLGQKANLISNTIFAVFDASKKDVNLLKGYIRVKNISSDTSAADIIKTVNPANPILSGDTIASPFYPQGNTFVLVGRVPANSPYSEDRIKAMIKAKGGVIEDTVTLTTNYVILMDIAPRLEVSSAQEQEEFFEFAYEAQRQREEQLTEQWGEQITEALGLKTPMINLSDIIIFLE